MNLGKPKQSLVKIGVCVLFAYLVINNAQAACPTYASSGTAQSACEADFGVPTTCTFISGGTGSCDPGTVSGVWTRPINASFTCPNGDPGPANCFYGIASSGCVPPQVENPTTGLCEDPTPPEENPCASTQGSIIRDLIGAAPVPVVCSGGCQYQNNQPAGGMTVTSTTSFTTSSTVTYVGNGVECDSSEQTNTPGTNTDVTDSDNDGIPEVNGEELPETPPPSDGCVLLPDGSLYCGGNAGSPPAPDDGTPGQPAAPDQTVTNSTTNTTNNYYDDTTTSGSSGGTPTGQDGGVCDPSVEICGTDQESAQDNGCGQLPTCNGDAIDCVILKMQHDTRCNLQTDIEDVTETDVMGQIGVTETVEEVFAVDPADEIDVNTEFFNVTANAGSCPADLVLSIPYAGNVNVPLTEVCNVLNLMRPAVILFSNLMAALMLFRAFRDGL